MADANTWPAAESRAEEIFQELGGPSHLFCTPDGQQYECVSLVGRRYGDQPVVFRQVVRWTETVSGRSFQVEFQPGERVRLRGEWLRRLDPEPQSANHSIYNAELLGKLEELLPLAEAVDTKCVRVTEVSCCSRPGESHETHIAEILSTLILRLRREANQVTMDTNAFVPNAMVSAFGDRYRELPWKS